MKVFRKGLGLILGGLMAISMIGCSNNQIEQAEELLKENIQNEIERNLEEYEPQYNELNDKERLYLNSTKDIDKIDVEIEELNDSYEATVTLGYKDEDIENVNDIFVLEIAKDKLTEEDLKNEDFLHETTYLETVVAHSSTYKGIDGELITWLYCEKGYEGHTKNEYGFENENENESNTVMICENWILEKDFLLCLGDLMFNI